MQILNGLNDLPGCFRSLNADGSDHERNGGKASCRDVQDVADDGSRGGGDHADSPGKVGNRFFPGGIKKSLGLQAGFQLFIRLLKSAGSPGFQRVKNQLVLSSRRVDGQSGSTGDLHAFLKVEKRETIVPEGPRSG
ncbi:MAG: hypothetical protein A4E74_01926 [Syntrophus sp. PtaB.Bin075]|nr:MAG: hypothetical protein A4E74_01926 [Syntrophus sp. PtaB.Bin075]